MTIGLLSSPSASLASPALEVVRKVEAKYPALLFKQQLTAYLEKIYGIIQDNLKKELTSVLALCIQVPPFLIQKIFSQTFSYINVQLFNSNGEYVKAAFAELELWCFQAKEEYAGSSWDELKHIRHSVGFLVLFFYFLFLNWRCKHMSREGGSLHIIITPTEESIRRRLWMIMKSLSLARYISMSSVVYVFLLCLFLSIFFLHMVLLRQVLSVQQLYRICALFWDGNYNTRSVSPDVLSSMRMLMAEDSNNAQSNSFLLDDSSSIPFSVDDLSASLQLKDFSDMKAAHELLESPAFQFLNE